MGRKTVAGPGVEAVGDGEVKVGREPGALYEDGFFRFWIGFEQEVELEAGVAGGGLFVCHWMGILGRGRERRLKEDRAGVLWEQFD